MVRGSKSGKGFAEFMAVKNNKHKKSRSNERLLKEEKLLLCGLDAELFLDTSRLAAAAAQVVELGAADIAAAFDFDLGD